MRHRPIGIGIQATRYSITASSPIERNEAFPLLENLDPVSLRSELAHAAQGFAEAAIKLGLPNEVGRYVGLVDN